MKYLLNCEIIDRVSTSIIKIWQTKNGNAVNITNVAHNENITKYYDCIPEIPDLTNLNEDEKWIKIFAEFFGEIENNSDKYTMYKITDNLYH